MGDLAIALVENDSPVVMKEQASAADIRVTDESHMSHLIDRAQTSLHQFGPARINCQTTICVACHKAIGCSSGQRCAVCLCICHTDCLSLVSSQCRDSNVPNSYGTFSSPQHYDHYWSEGIITTPQPCAACFRPVGKRICGQMARRCAYCMLVLHRGCPTVQIPCSSVYDAMRCTYSPSHSPAALCVPGHGTSTVLAFVNPNAGELQGRLVLLRLRALLSVYQVCDLSVETPLAAIQRHLNCGGLHLLVAGGDGTQAWVLNTIHELHLDSAATPAIAPLPLGTANDLSRSLGWGGGYQGEDLSRILQNVVHATPEPLDRWRISFQPTGAATESSKIMLNYFSVGTDAEIAHMFHVARLARPGVPRSRIGNMIRYFFNGAKLQCVKRDPVAAQFDLELDGQIVALPPRHRCVIVLNLQSYAAGHDLWAKGSGDPRKPPSSCDGLLEVVAVRNVLHLGMALIKCRGAVRVGQASVVRFLPKLSQNAFVQIDGEPFVQPPATITIAAAASRVTMLRHQ